MGVLSYRREKPISIETGKCTMHPSHLGCKTLAQLTYLDCTKDFFKYVQEHVSKKNWDEMWPFERVLWVADFLAGRNLWGVEIIDVLLPRVSENIIPELSEDYNIYLKIFSGSFPELFPISEALSIHRFVELMEMSIPYEYQAKYIDILGILVGTELYKEGSIYDNSMPSMFFKIRTAPSELAFEALHLLVNRVILPRKKKIS